MAAAPRLRAMRTGWLRYPVIALLVAAAGGLLVSCSAGHPQTSATQGRSAHPQTSAAGRAAHPRNSATADRARHAGTRLARIYPLPCGACPAIVIPGRVGPNWAREIHKAGRTGQAVLVSGPPVCLVGQHPVVREATRSCPLAAVTAVP